MELYTIENMQVKYPKKQQTRCWDPVHLEYPVRKFPETGTSSVTIGHQYYGPPEVLKGKRDPLTRMKEHFHDYEVDRDLMRSQSTLDFGLKHPETKRHNKHTSCTENQYIYPPSRRLAERPPLTSVHGMTEMKSAYEKPTTPARLVTRKEQFMLPAPQENFPPEAPYNKELEPLDTTYEGFEKYLDPYLTTSRLHHRPYTAEQLSRESNAPAKSIVTYYTFSDTPMVRTPKTKPEFWRLPLPSRPKSMYDRDKFKQDIREMRTHRNRPSWVPGSFRTEIRDNFTSFMAKPEYGLRNIEDDVGSFYKKSLAALPPIDIKYEYTTENSIIGSGKPLCTFFDPYQERNKKLEIRENKIMQKYRS